MECKAYEKITQNALTSPTHRPGEKGEKNKKTNIGRFSEEVLCFSLFSALGSSCWLAVGLQTAGPPMSLPSQ
jgi:hypothetical protein